MPRMHGFIKVKIEIKIFNRKERYGNAKDAKDCLHLSVLRSPVSVILYFLICLINPYKPYMVKKISPFSGLRPPSPFLNNFPQNPHSSTHIFGYFCTVIFIPQNTIKCGSEVAKLSRIST
jgi:hypothetical protein